jgi:four helix bundle protein
MVLVKGVHGILQWVEIPGSIRQECLCQQGLFWMESMTTAREAAKSFQDLIVWRKAHELVLEVYRLTEQFPQREIYGLSHQLRRAAVSIPANIAEGFRKRGPADKTRFLNIAEGSVEECRYYLILTQDLGYGDTEKLRHLLAEVSRLLNAYIKAILTPGS